MKIATKLLLSYAVIVIMLLISGTVSMNMLDRVGDSLTDFYNKQFQTVDYAWTARRSTYALRANLLQAMKDNDVEVTNNCITQAEEHYNMVLDAIEKVHSTFEGDPELLKQADALIEQATPVMSEMAELSLQNKNDEAYELLINDYTPIMDQVRSLLEQVGQEADTNALNRVHESNSLTRSSVILILTILVISTVLSILLSILIARSIRRPVMEMRRISEDIEKGNLETVISYKSKDELGQLADNMRGLSDGIRTIITDISHFTSSMADGNFTVESESPESYKGDYESILKSMELLRGTMSETLTQINISSNQVNAGGEMVSSGAQALAQGATEQASSVEELASTINNISARINATAEHAKTAREENEKANSDLETCNQYMNDLVEAMQLIEEKAKQINGIIKTIDDIAFQTNILALNAAVEAARAGTAGKGFAVVAEEVRNLASKSAEAVKSTTALIEETVKAVSKGAHLSDTTEEMLGQVVENSASVLNNVVHISEDTEEQSKSVAQVSVGIDQISSVVQTNSATAEQSAAASEELSAQANVLKELVGQFQLQESAEAQERANEITF